MPILPLNIPKDINKYFYNRIKDINRINNYLNGLNNNISEQILITGHRGIGKTFLLKKILSEQPDYFLTAYLDISQIYATNKGKLTEEEVLKQLLNIMNQAVLNRLDTFQRINKQINDVANNIFLKDYDFKEAATILNISIPQTEDNYQKLSRFVMEFPQKIVDSSDEINGFIIVIDEFQLLKSLENPKSFFWLLRSFTQNQDNVSYIFTGSTSETSEIVKMINGSSGAFGGRVIQLNIDPFTKEETRSYFKEKLPEIEFTEDGFDRFYKCTRGIPAYINSFCNVLSVGIKYDSDLIKKEFMGKLNQILIMWIDIWGNLHSNEKEIVLLLVNYTSLTWTQLSNRVSFSDATLIKYLDHLNNKGILCYNNKKYELEDKMLKLWLVHEKEINGKYPY